MDQILEQLRGLFISSIPSVILLILLYFFLKRVLFDPLEKILAERYSITEGREKDARDAVRAAEQKSEEYARALHAAKAEIYAQQEALRKKLEAEREDAIAAAAERTAVLLAEGRKAVAMEAEASEARMLEEAKSLALLVKSKVLFQEAS